MPLARLFWKSKSLVSLGVVLVGSVGAAQAPNTYRLSDRAEAGDVSKDTEDITLDAAFQVAGKTGEIPIHFQSKKQYRNMVLAADGGEATKVRRAYLIFRDSEQVADNKKVRTSLQGKTVLLQRSGDVTKVTALTGAISAEDRKDLSDALNGSGNIYPDRALAIGDEWTPDARSLKAFRKAKDLKIRGKLLEVVPFAGRSCAHAHFTFSARIPLDPQSSMLLQLEGEGYHAIDLKRNLSLALTGPVTFKGSTVIDGVSTALTGTGTIRVKEVVQWEKVAGKPVSISGESLANQADTKAAP